MRGLIDSAKIDPRIIAAAHNIVSLTPEKNHPAEVRALYDFVRQSIRYTADVNGVETLSNPAHVLLRRSGDCDDQTTLLCALFESIGYPTRLIIARYDGETWEHVYCQVFVDGQWIDCEPIQRDAFLGYAYPGPSAIWIERR